MRGPSQVWLRRRIRIRLRPTTLLLLLLFSHSLLALVCSLGVWAGEDVDKRALLQFKAAVASDPSGILAGWSDSPGSHPCSWPGVTCDSRSRVSALNVSARSGSPSCAPNPFGDRSCSDPKLRFSGKLAPEIGQLSELRVLSLPFHRFDGVIPREISVLEHLEVLDLEGNSLSGPIPQRFGQQLRVLNLGFNYLTGGVPESLVNSAVLEIMDLSHNQLNGTIPLFLGKSFKLEMLDLSFNRLGGPVPDGICNALSTLEHLDLSGNMLTGGIPSSLGNCSKLQALLLFNNLLDGFIPAEIGKLWKLQVLDLSRNSLSGTLPAELGNCSELSVLVLSNIYDPVPNEDYSSDGSGINDFNYFQGGIDESITSLPKLRILWAPRAMLEGRLPSKWNACGSLQMVNLGQNLFTGGIPPAFGQCKYLKHLNLSSNKLTGGLRDELPVPCMDVFDVSGNQLSGSIPNFTYNRCPSLQFSTYNLASAYLTFFQRMAQSRTPRRFSEATLDFTILHDFGNNNFNGIFPFFPVSIENLGKKTIYAFLAGGNSLFGSFPGNIFDNCRSVKGLILNISNNMISGVIPPEIDSICTSLIVLDISGNHISGTIPPHLGFLESLVALDLSRNKLHGQIPANFSLLKELKHLSLAANNLTGDIPLCFSQLYSLRVLDLSSNFLSGGIPGDLVKLRNLSTLLLNNNKLSGSIPASVVSATSLFTFNVSFNNLSGPVPSNASVLRCDSVIGNPLLKPCPVISLSVPPAELQGRSGDSLPDTASSPGSSQGGGRGFTTIEIASISSAAAIVSVLLALIVLYIYTRYCAPRSTIPTSRRRELTVFADIGVPLTYENVVRATGGFNANNCIGSGGFGATYKAEIASGVVVAVKRLSVGRIQGVQQFHAEIKTLGRWRHPNLVTLIGFHVSEAEMFLIYNYLPGGNLENFIKERSKRPVDWRMLHKIALDVARALAYLHDHCVPRILHRDVKPSNILLDNEFNAYLSDFGLARLLGNSETHATTGVAGTFGYVAPEYAMTCRVSDKADVYSYGVVLLELISDKKALDPSFSPYGNGFNIVAWACMLLKQGRAREFFTEGLWNVGPRDDLVETLHLAIMCTDDSLSSRPTMKLVVQKLKRIQPPTCSPIRHVTS